MIGEGDSWYKVLGYQGTTQQWCQSDTEFKYRIHMRNDEKRRMIEAEGWTADNVSYTFNAHGFRSEEFESGDSVMFLGCSLTAGIGVDLENTWAYKVASSLGLRRYNLGVGAGCIDMCFRLAQYWIPRLRPKYVVMLTPDVNRVEIVTPENDILYLPNMMEPDQFYKRWLSNPVNANMNRLKNQIAIRHICEKYDARLFETTVEETLKVRKSLIHKNWARDLMHPGREWHAGIADDFLKMMT